jgi:type IV pilus assembly protein PilC
MTKYQYVAVDMNGSTVKDRIEADSEAEARRTLLLANLDVKSVDLRQGLFERDFGRGPRIKPIEILHFTRQMAAFIRAGLSIVDGLDVIARSTQNESLVALLHSVRDEVREGVPFEEALAQHQRVLPRYYVGVVRSASLTGHLDGALEQLAGYMERELEAKSRIKSALTYPAVIIGMSVVSVVVLTVWVLPRFVDLFNDLGATLPLSTRAIMGIARFSQQFWWLYIVFFAAAGAFGWWARRTPSGRNWSDRVVLRLPVVGEIAQFAAVERVCRILGTLWQAGVPVADAMAAAIASADNVVFEEGLVPVQEAVMAGEGLAEPLAMCGLFPDAAVQMISVGEASGTIAEQLENAANFFGRELEYKLRRLTSLFEPAVIVIVGVVVGFVALALVQAMYGSLGGVGKP